MWRQGSSFCGTTLSFSSEITQPVFSWTCKYNSEKAVPCSLGDFYEPAVALVFTICVNNPGARAKFLELKNCTLDRALFIAQKRTQNAAETQQPGSEDFYLPVIYSSVDRNSQESANLTTKIQWGCCLSCGAKHRRQDCKFSNVECHQCHKKGNIAIVCKSKNSSNFSLHKPQNVRRKAHFDDETIYKRSHSSVNSITAPPEVCTISQMPQTDLSVVWLQMNSIPLRILLDTGFPFIIPNQDTREKIGSSSLSPIFICANSFSGDPLSFAGEVATNVQSTKKYLLY